MRTNPLRKLLQNFRTRIFFLLIILILVTTTTFTIFYIVNESASARQLLGMEGELLARLLARNARLAIFAEHPDMLRDATEGIFHHEHVLITSVYLANGKLLTERSRNGKEVTRADEEDPDKRQALSQFKQGEFSVLRFQKADRVDFFAPVLSAAAFSSPETLYFNEPQTEDKSRPIGMVRVGIDKNQLLARLHTIALTGFSMGALFIVLGSILVFLVAQGLTRPLEHLMEGVRAIREGDLSAQVPVETEDELGEVSRAFNVMVQTLRQREQENRELGEQLREALQMKAKEEWERTFDTVPDLIAILDGEHRIVRINKAMADRLGIAKEAAVGMELCPLLHGPECPPDFDTLSDLLALGATYFGEFYQEKLQSFFLVTVSPLLKSGGGTGSVYVARDITQRKQAEELLQNAEERFRLIADTIVEVIWMTDVEVTKILYISPAYEQVWGRSLESLYEAPRSFIDAVHPDDRHILLAALENQGTGEPYDIEYRIIRPDGAARWIWDRGYPVRDKLGQITCYTGVAQDISTEKQVEEEKRAIQAKLVQTNKMTSLGLLVSGLAHEVNNPNNNIKLIGHILSKSWQDISPILEKHYSEEGDFRIAGQSFLEIRNMIPQHILAIRNNSRRIEGIIKNLRDFARKGAANVNFKADINTIVSIAASLINLEIKRHTRHFKLDLQEGLPTVQGNPQQLEQVVINLIMNAIQALPDRERAVLVATSFDQAEGRIIIRIADEGEGMSSEVRDRIGEPFFSTKLDRGGTGLGLAISNFIVSEHKGALELESEPGKGTTALIKLPADLSA